MAQQTSFRRILLGYLLLLSVPVLVFGLGSTYRQVQNASQKDAREDLEKDAQNEGLRIRIAIDATEGLLLAARDSRTLQSGTPQESKQFLERLVRSSSSGEVRCIRLEDVASRIVASTCDARDEMAPLPADFWLEKPDAVVPPASFSHVAVRPAEANLPLRAIFSAPIYAVGDDAEDVEENTAPPRYILRFEIGFEQLESSERSELVHRLLIDREGTILASSNDPSKVGKSIDEQPDAALLRDSIDETRIGESGFTRLPNFDAEGKELLAGFSTIPSPIDERGKWVVVAATRLEDSLADLQEVRQAMFTLFLWSLAANLAIALIIAQRLSAPVEQLGAYARNIECRTDISRIPDTFHIREFKQLADALNRTFDRFTAWGSELEIAWREAKSANQLRDNFLATISHELRTPLNAIIGGLRFVIRGLCDDREEEIDWLQRADRAAVQLLSIVDDILDIAKIQAGQLSLEIQRVDLHACLQESVDLQKVDLQEKSLKASVPDLSCPLFVRADGTRLRQIFDNLLNNAIKFTDAGEIAISTHTEFPADGSPVAIVRIVDTGIGIDPELQPRLFQPFAMLDGSHTRRQGGTGLGLAIARNLLERMSGRIAIESQGRGFGTTVICTVPLDISADTTAS